MLQLQEIISPPDDRYILYAAIAALWLRNKVLEDRWLALREVLDEFTHALRDWTDRPPPVEKDDAPEDVA